MLQVLVLFVELDVDDAVCQVCVEQIDHLCLANEDNITAHLQVCVDSLQMEMDSLHELADFLL